MTVATETEVFRAILEIEERGNIKAAQADIKAAEALMAELHAQMKAGKVGFDQYAREAEELARELVDLRAALAGVAASDADDFFERLGIQTDIAARTTRGLAQAKGTLSGASRNSAGALLEFSRAAEDAQYGIAGVLNNIPGLLMALGAGAGLIGVVSLAAIGVAQLVKHWDDLVGMFGSGKVETEAQEMERLAKATGLTADETARLKKLKDADAEKKAAAAEVDAMAKEQSDRQKELGESVRKAFAESGGAEGVRGDLVRGELDYRKGAGYYRRADGTDDSAAVDRDRKILDDQIKALTRTAIHSNDSKAQADALKLLRSFAKNGPAGFDLALKAADPGAEKARADDADRLRRERTSRERAEAQQEAAFKLREAAAGTHADRLDAGPLAAIADAGGLTREKVERAMKREGAKPADVARLAPAVLDQLRRRSDARVQDYAAENGLDVPGARKQMAKERAEAENKATGVEGWRVGDGLPDDPAPAREEGAARAMAAMMRGGMSGGEAQREVYRQLRGSIGEGAARVTARNATWDAAAEYENTRQKRHSTVMDSAGVADALQAAVGGGDDYQRKAWEELRASNKLLQAIANNKDSGPRLRK